MRFSLFLVCVLFIFPVQALASVEYREGTIQAIEIKESEQVYSLKDSKSGEFIEIIENSAFFRGGTERFQEGDKIIYTKTIENGEVGYFLNDHSRVESVIWWGIAFILFTLLLTKGKSFGALLGLISSIWILFGGMIPAIEKGNNPLLIGFIAALLISLISLYSSHGLRKSTTVSILSVWITAGITFLLALLAIHQVHLFGFGEESASVLVMNGYNLPFREILLAGILLGTIGILDDVASTQIEALLQMRDLQPNISFSELVKKGMAIGNEHIFSMVNTLVLVYFSASICGILLMASATDEMNIIINSEMIAEEIIKTIIGSFGIVLAVPISTLFGAWTIEKKFI